MMRDNIDRPMSSSGAMGVVPNLAGAAMVGQDRARLRRRPLEPQGPGPRAAALPTPVITPSLSGSHALSGFNGVANRPLLPVSSSAPLFPCFFCFLGAAFASARGPRRDHECRPLANEHFLAGPCSLLIVFAPSLSSASELAVRPQGFSGLWTRAWCRGAAFAHAHSMRHREWGLSTRLRGARPFTCSLPSRWGRRVWGLAGPSWTGPVTTPRAHDLRPASPAGQWGPARFLQLYTPR